MIPYIGNGQRIATWLSLPRVENLEKTFNAFLLAFQCLANDLRIVKAARASPAFDLSSMQNDWNVRPVAASSLSTFIIVAAADVSIPCIHLIRFWIDETIAGHCCSLAYHFPVNSPYDNSPLSIFPRPFTSCLLSTKIILPLRQSSPGLGIE